MLLDANELSAGATLQADVCIAGAGAAGITLALTLRDAGVDVILLESGGLESEPDTQALYEGTMSGIDTWELDKKRWRLFGGSTSRWAGWCRPLEREDFERRSYVAGSGWPITFDDLVPFYERAHARVQLADFLWDTSRLQELSGRPLIESPGGRLRTTVFQYSPPTRFGELYRSDISESENIRGYLHANVVNVVLASNGGEVSRVECATLDGVAFHVEARAYVLAMGGIENVRLMLASNTQFEEGIANSSGAVGRFFMEHPHYNGVCSWVLSRPSDFSFYERHEVALPEGDGTKKLDVRGLLALTPETLAEEGLPSVAASLVEAAVDSGQTGDIDAEQVRSLVRDRDEALVYQLNVHAEQTPRSESRVTLRASDRDSLGMPRVDLNWQVHPDDERDMRRALQILSSELSAAGLGRVWTPTDGERLTWTTLPGGHHMGTARMSEDPELGVVDANCRCHDVENLYIAGSAVFTTAGYANPTLTIVALAERLASHLVEVLA